MIGRPTVTIDMETATDEDWETVFETQRRVEGGGKLEPGTVVLGKRVTITGPAVGMLRAVIGQIDGAED